MQNILTAIKHAYKKEPYRILDIINSLDPNQLHSKEWLIDKFKPKGTGIVLGGWYGYLANHYGFRSVDIDPGTKEYGRILYPNVDFKVDCMLTHIMNRGYDNYICTSCEHVEQYELDLFNHKPGTYCLQSTDDDTCAGHINTKTTLEEFKSDYNWKEIIYEGSRKRGQYNRWLIIGKIG